MWRPNIIFDGQRFLFCFQSERIECPESLGELQLQTAGCKLQKEFQNISQHLSILCFIFNNFISQFFQFFAIIFSYTHFLVVGNMFGQLLGIAWVS
jgi:hypothetical protein